MRTHRGFTLLELVVVVATTASLVTILLSVASQARAIAKKDVCGNNIRNHGKSVMTYSSQYDSYPFMCQTRAGGWADISMGGVIGFTPALGWPKFYGLMQISGVKRPVPAQLINSPPGWGLRYYYMSNTRLADMWPGSVCPAQDYVATVMASIQASYQTTGMGWVQMHKYAMGYEWNQFLTSAVPYTSPWWPGPGVGVNRYPRNPVQTDWSELSAYDLWQWVGRATNLPDGTLVAQQSVRPAEVERPADVAEAWDSWDLGSTPGVAWASGASASGSLTPGWASGFPKLGNYVAFNGYRHRGPCNILYADGHVASDAETDMPADILTGNLVGAKMYTWSGMDGTWGQLGKILGSTTFGTTWR